MKNLLSGVLFFCSLGILSSQDFLDVQPLSIEYDLVSLSLCIFLCFSFAVPLQFLCCSFTSPCLFLYFVYYPSITLHSLTCYFSLASPLRPLCLSFTFPLLFLYYSVTVPLCSFTCPWLSFAFPWLFLYFHRRNRKIFEREWNSRKKYPTDQ